MFIEDILSCIEEGREYDEKAFFDILGQFEKDWAENDREIKFREASDPIELSYRILPTII